jgi:hypothetical protein
MAMVMVKLSLLMPSQLLILLLQKPNYRWRLQR